MSRPKILRCGQSKAEIEFLASPAKELVLPGVVCGECQQDQGKLVFRADGTGTWSCTTTNWDDKRNATWYTDFSLQDVNGLTLFGIGPFFSLCMVPRTPVHAYALLCMRHFEFPTAYFKEIASAAQNYGCLFGLPTNSWQSAATPSDAAALTGHPVHRSYQPAKPFTRCKSNNAEAGWSRFGVLSSF